jgi:hypothetical protein
MSFRLNDVTRLDEWKQYQTYDTERKIQIESMTKNP